jgi:hypothetical protein
MCRGVTRKKSAGVGIRRGWYETALPGMGLEFSVYSANMYRYSTSIKNVSNMKIKSENALL